MSDFNWTFDARTVQPRQGGGAHPVGNKFPFKITSVEVVSTKNNDGGMLNVEFTSEAGSIVKRYGLWNANETTRNIAQEQLSALCHVVGIFQIGPNKGKELIGGQGLMDVGFQKGHEPSAERPAGGYVELKKVYTLAGLEPGQSVPVQQTQAVQAVQAVQAAQAQPTANSAAAQQSWGGAQTNGAAPVANAEPAQTGGWGAGGAAPSNSPPWGS